MFWWGAREVMCLVIRCQILVCLKRFVAQAQKVYVQDRIRHQAEHIWKLISQQSAHFYVCGDALNMAGAVEKELLRIIASNMGDDTQAAQKYLDDMSTSGRYQRDVWY